MPTSFNSGGGGGGGVHARPCEQTLGCGSFWKFVFVCFLTKARNLEHHKRQGVKTGGWGGGGGFTWCHVWCSNCLNFSVELYTNYKCWVLNGKPTASLRGCRCADFFFCLRRD